MKFICTVCNFIHEVSDSNWDRVEDAHNKFDKMQELDKEWICPQCAATREFFQPCSCVSSRDQKSQASDKSEQIAALTYEI